jgi:uncharacterized protein (TIGR00730 family)
MEKTTKELKKIAIFGDGAAKENDDHYKDAYETSKLLAKNGYVIVNGGGPGIMLAATLGAKEAGGIVEIVTINPANMGENYEGKNMENVTKADVEYTTNNYDERVAKLAEVADAFVVFKGGTGTLSELTMTWSKAKFDFGHHEPIILYGKFWKEILGVIEKDMGLEETEREVITVVETPEGVLAELAKVGN